MGADLKDIRIKDDYLRQALKGEVFLIEDGGMGSMLQARGLMGDGVCPDLLNLTNAEAIVAIQREYVQAGAQVITTNTFGANALKLDGRASVADVYRAAADNARKAGRYVAGDIGPSGSLLEPMGTMTFDEAYDLFAEQAIAARDAQCDLIIVETMADLREAKAAVLAARENTDLPIFVTMTFGEDGRTFLGTTPAIAAATLSSLGVSAVGLNCSLGPDELAPLAAEMAEFARCPIIVKPNAGLPRMEEGRTVYDISPESFAQAMEAVMDAGATIVGGCCGTTPDFIRCLSEVVAERLPEQRSLPNSFVVTSAQRACVLPAGKPCVEVIGERINPTGKPKLKEALRNANYDYLVGEAVAQVEAGAAILDVNVGLPELDEPSVLKRAVETLQATVAVPLQIDSSDPEAIEAAVRGYAGKPLINSVNGKKANLEAVLPLVKKYGCSVVGLTLDEGGIPPTAEGRFDIARRIVEAAESYGIPRSDVAIDCLVMSAATNQSEVTEILRAVSLVKRELGVRTVLGVSNVSFGLPQRNMVNSAFLAAAFGAGLDMPILNPLSARYADTVAAYRVLNGQDVGGRYFLDAYAQACDPYEGGQAHSAAASTASCVEAHDDACVIAIPDAFADAEQQVRDIVHYVLAGRSQPMAGATLELLRNHQSLDVINGVFVPVLDVVGLKYDRGEFFLPQLMASAEAVKAGFDALRSQVQESAEASSEILGDDAAAANDGGNTVVVATVEGDIHDIGKNIVKMLLENYGFPVVDLGKDVTPERIVRALKDSGARLLGLSALMTTTVKAMERTVKLVHEQLPGVAVMVGGAVLTQEYSDAMGADFFAKDAAEAARVATRFFK